MDLLAGGSGDAGHESKVRRSPQLKSSSATWRGNPWAPPLTLTRDWAAHAKLTSGPPSCALVQNNTIVLASPPFAVTSQVALDKWPTTPTCTRTDCRRRR